MIEARKARLLIVDDSALVRQLLTTELSQDPRIEVVGAAPDAFAARDMIVRLEPDVITLDIQMPRMDGSTFLRRLMRHHPMPVVVLSSYVNPGTKEALEALTAGAVDVFAKPPADDPLALKDAMLQLADVIHAASLVKPETLARRPPPDEPPSVPKLERVLGPPGERLVVAGASTGGTDALLRVVSGLGHDCPPLGVVIHMPPMFTERFAESLDRHSAATVREARDRDQLRRGLVLIAPGDNHLVVVRQPEGFIVRVRPGPLICRHRPSVEALFLSAAREAGASAMGIIMTGMGTDGAGGLAAMRKAGSYTVAQDEESCLVFGMPREALQRNAVVDLLPLGSIARAIVDWDRGALGPWGAGPAPGS